MAESIKLPSITGGTPEQQLHQMYSYLYRMAQTMNVNLKEIGNGALTDEEAALMNRITAELQEPGIQAQPSYNYAEAETLKSLIIKTAQFVKNEVDNYRLVLFGEESAEGSQGNWKRKKGLRVDVTPDGVQQTYSYAEIVQGLKTFEINAKNYIKTGYLRTVNAVPIYGVAIGRDVVTFSEDGTETYNDSNKVAELTADALSFYQGGNIVAKYTGSKMSFYIGGSEIFYIQSGKIYCAQNLELASGKKLIIDTTNFKVDSSGNVTISGKISAGSGSTFAGTMSADCITSGSIDASVIEVKNINASKITSGSIDASVIEVKNINASKITSGSIDASVIEVKNINASKITSGSIDASVIEVKNINASKITSGTMSANKISGGSIDASDVTITNLNASNISSGTMSASKINGGTLTLGGNNNTNGIMQIKNGSGTVFGTINKDGIAYSGDLTISSGGSLDVESTNFKIDSDNKLIEIGNWKFDDNGFILTTQSGSQKQYVEMKKSSSFGVEFYLHEQGLSDKTEFIFDETSFYGKRTTTPQTYTNLGSWSYPWDTVYYNNLSQVSSRNRKHNIKPLPDRGAEIDALEPVTFVYNGDAEERTRAGLIYEDTIGVMPEICTGDEENKGINYVELIPYLLKEIQELRKRVKALENKEDR